MKKYYKCVDTYNGKKHSAVAYSVHCQIYYLNKWTYANPGTKLFVFNNIWQAVEFSNNKHEIFECEVLHPRKPYKFRAMASPVHIKKYWEHVALMQKKHKNINKSFENIKHITAEMPAGTVFCDAVKLIERVQSYQ